MTPHRVRAITSDDFGFLRRLFAARFPNDFDAETTENWMRELVLKGPMNFHAVRTDDAFCISIITAFPWRPTDRHVNVVTIVADHGAVWQALPLLRASIAWARARQATTWRCQSDMETADLAPLLRRLRVPEAGPRFKMFL